MNSNCQECRTSCPPRPCGPAYVSFWTLCLEVTHERPVPTMGPPAYSQHACLVLPPRLGARDLKCFDPGVTLRAARIMIGAGSPTYPSEHFAVGTPFVRVPPPLPEAYNLKCFVPGVSHGRSESARAHLSICRNLNISLY